MGGQKVKKKREKKERNVLKLHFSNTRYSFVALCSLQNMWGFFILKSWIELSHYTVYSYIPSCPGRGGVNSTQFFGPNEQFKNFTWQCCTVYMRTQSVKVLRYRVRFLIRIFRPDPTSVNPNLLPWATSRAYMLSPESSLHCAIYSSIELLNTPPPLPLPNPDWTKIFFFFFWIFVPPGHSCTVFSGVGIVSETPHPAVWDTHISS